MLLDAGSNVKLLSVFLKFSLNFWIYPVRRLGHILSIPALEHTLQVGIQFTVMAFDIQALEKSGILISLS